MSYYKKIKKILEEKDLVDYISTSPRVMSGATRAYKRWTRKQSDEFLAGRSGTSKYKKIIDKKVKAKNTVPIKRKIAYNNLVDYD